MQAYTHSSLEVFLRLTYAFDEQIGKVLLVLMSKNENFAWKTTQHLLSAHMGSADWVNCVATHFKTYLYFIDN